MPGQREPADIPDTQGDQDLVVDQATAGIRQVAVQGFQDFLVIAHSLDSLGIPGDQDIQGFRPTVDFRVQGCLAIQGSQE